MPKACHFNENRTRISTGNEFENIYILLSICFHDRQNGRLFIGITEKPDPGPVGPDPNGPDPAEYPFISMFPDD